jgi:hypothetical protein
MVTGVVDHIHMTLLLGNELVGGRFPWPIFVRSKTHGRLVGARASLCCSEYTNTEDTQTALRPAQGKKSVHQTTRREFRLFLPGRLQRSPRHIARNVPLSIR